MEALYFSENFVYTSTYARVPGKDIVPQPCSPRTAWMVPTVTYHDYRVVVGVHELDYGQR